MNCDIGKIHIKNLLVRGILGINAEEREKKQDILINIELWASTKAAQESDQIVDAVNYKDIAKLVIKHVEENQPYLVEKLCSDLINLCFKQDSKILEAEIMVDKPGALRFAEGVGVTLRKKRPA